MKIKFTYRRPAGGAVDLVATLDSKATVGDLATYLLSSDPVSPGTSVSDPTLCLVDRGNQILAADLPVTDSPLRSGATVAVMPSSRYCTGGSSEQPVAVMSILTGPDSGREFALPLGSTVVGREETCDITLRDPMISRRHVRIGISDMVELHDLASANGTLVGGRSTAQAMLRPSDVVQLGDSTFTVRLLHQAPVGASMDLGTAVTFVRSPLVVDRFEGQKFEAPQAPERQRPQRMPLVTLLVPILMAFVLYMFTKSMLSVVFAGLSPLMLIGGVLEARRSAKLDFAEAVKGYESDLAALGETMDAALAVERQVRDLEQPSVEMVRSAVAERTPLMWSRRPGDDNFLCLRLAVGVQLSRSCVEVPTIARAPFELWAKARDLAEARQAVPGVPLVGDLRQSAIGVAGPRRLALPLLRGLMAQVIGLHSPAETVVTVLCSPETAADWDWLKWVPHTSAPQSPISSRHFATSPAGAAALVTDLENLLARRDASFVASAHDPAVLLLVEVDSPADYSRVVALAELGPSLGVHVVCLAPEQALLPAACRTFLAVSPDGAQLTVGDVVERQALPATGDPISAEAAAAMARAMASVVDLGARVLDASDIPRSVSQLAMLGTRLGAEHEAVLERWTESASVLTGPYAPSEPVQRAANLRAVLGQSASGPHTIDLRTDGPHALVGGTTGAGKSELLQSWVLSLATAHSPQRVNFLFVDYKGGAAFAECENLPHSLGVVTDLSAHLVRRALTSLKAELHYRERLLARHRAKDLVQMERQGKVEAPPSLVIVVDEFAALVKEVPDFVDGVVDVAQRGRSLGLHLILATQRPAGVIKDNLRANTNLRIALRMADSEDSSDVLGRPDAAAFDPEIPGRAMSKAGPRAAVPFQGSYAGGWTTDETERPEILVEELVVTESRPWEAVVETGQVVRDENQTDIRRLVRRITEAARAAQLPAARRVWMPDLPSSLDVAGPGLQLSTTDDRLVFGLSDDPEHQAQPPVAFEPDREGHIVFYGTSGSGKSTALRTLALAAGFAAVSTPVRIHALDFGSRGLSSLEPLPHVGSVIAGQDHERVVRLLTELRATIDERALRFTSAQAATLSEYRRNTGVNEHRVLVLLDGLPAFRNAYESGDRQRWADLFGSILADGRPMGVHVAMSSDQRSGLSPAMAAAVQRRIVLRMATPDDYSMLGTATDVLDATSPPGRGLDGDRSVQVAILGDSPDILAQSERMLAFGAKMTEWGVPATPEIGTLPDVVPVASLDLAPGSVAVGLAGETLATHFVTPEGGFLLTGPAGSGRSTVLHAMVTSARRANPRMRWHYLGQRRSALAALGLWETSCTSVDDASAWAEAVSAELKEVAGGTRRIGIIIESAGDYVNSLAEMSLQAMVRTAMADGHWVVAEGEASTLISGMGFVGQVKAARTGAALQPDQELGGHFKTPFPRVNRADFPVGRGFFVRNGRTALVQFGVPWDVATDEVTA